MGGGVAARRRPLVAAVLALACVLAAVGAGWAAGAWRPDTRPPLTSALASLPADTRIVGFTHWERIRAALGPDLNAFQRDLSTRSVLQPTADVLEQAYGWSVDDLQWEAYGQAAGSSVTVLRVTAGLSWDVVRDGLRDIGYDGGDDRWSVEAPVLSGLGASDLLAEVALVPREGLIVLSDTAAPVDLALDVLAGRADSLADDRTAAATAQALAGSDAVLMQAGDLGCESAAIPDGEAVDQAAVAQARAGDVVPFVYSGRGITERGSGAGLDAQSMRFAMTFRSAAQAGEQARVRAALASGPFIGRTGTVEETLRLDTARADGRTAVLELDHDPDSAPFMVGRGPLLFASC